MLDEAEKAGRQPRVIQVYREDHAALRRELTQGLMQAQAHCSPKFLYDALGSRLFEAITELPEYYPTRTEAALFASHGQEIAQALPKGATFLDLGAGNCNKAAALFWQFEPARYVAIDISVRFLQDALQCLQRQHPGMEMWGLGVDFSGGVVLPAPIEQAAAGPRLWFYPGSSIGNFTPDAALGFLRSVRQACGPDKGSGLLIGVDLVKDTPTLEAAYDDALGVTAAFNLNLLLHLNRLLQANFHLPEWRHRAHYDPVQQRIEMHLQARDALTVQWRDESGQPRQRFMQAGQTLHTENSYKWTVHGFSDLLQQAGFGSQRHWTDEAQAFAVFWARAQ